MSQAWAPVPSARRQRSEKRVNILGLARTQSPILTSFTCRVRLFIRLINRCNGLVLFRTNPIVNGLVRRSLTLRVISKLFVKLIRSKTLAWQAGIQIMLALSILKLTCVSIRFSPAPGTVAFTTLPIKWVEKGIE